MKLRRLFADIENSPNIGLFWKSGFKLTIGPENIVKERAVICIAYKWEGEDTVHTLQWDSRQNDKAMLRKFAKVCAKADEVVGHNGDRHDWAWVRTRSLFHGLPTFPDIKTVDTLKMAKLKFAFNSNRLDYIARLLGIGAKVSTGFDLWKEVFLDKCPKALAKMVAYCQNDVRLLEAVYHKLAPHFRAATNVAVVEGNPAWACPRCGSTNVKKSKTRVNPTGSLQHQMRCKDCGEYYTINNAEFKRYAKEKSAYAKAKDSRPN